MTDTVPRWLLTMRAITGTIETPGAADNPQILAWRDEIARRFPEMAAYCRDYTHDAIPWCGLTVAYCMAANGIRPVFGPRAVDRFLWAGAWMQFGTRLAQPKPGCIMVFTRDGGGHVTLFEREDGDYYVCRGGNQSDAVTVARYPKSAYVAAVWPEVAALPLRRRQTAISATEFADARVAYADVKPGWNGRPGVALPFRFKGLRPTVRVFRDRRSIDCEIIDIGPWYDGRPGWPFDPYWQTGARPRAETDPRTNRAGIDLTLPAARALGLNGKGPVDWEFVTSPPGRPAPPTSAPIGRMGFVAAIVAALGAVAHVIDAHPLIAAGAVMIAALLVLGIIGKLKGH